MGLAGNLGAAGFGAQARSWSSAKAVGERGVFERPADEPSVGGGGAPPRVFGPMEDLRARRARRLLAGARARLRRNLASGSSRRGGQSSRVPRDDDRQLAARHPQLTSAADPGGRAARPFRRRGAATPASHRRGSEAAAVAPARPDGGGEYGREGPAATATSAWAWREAGRRGRCSSMGTNRPASTR